MDKLEGFVLEADPVQKGGQSGLRLFVKTLAGATKRVFAPFEAYFYLLPTRPEAAEKEVPLIKAFSRGAEVAIKRIEKTEKLVSGKPANLLKVFAHTPADVPALREVCRRWGETFEDDIPFARRFLIDNAVLPAALYEISLEKDGRTVAPNGFKLLENKEHASPKLTTMAFDIETYNPAGIPNGKTDPCIMISYAMPGGNDKQGVLTYSKKVPYPHVKVFENEKQMIDEFCALVAREKVDLLSGYNSDEFDLPYLMDRANALKTELKLGRDKKPINLRKLGLRRRAKISGRIHFDAFTPISFLNFIGAYKFPRLTLGVVFKEMFGEEKLDTKKTEIWKAWDAEGKELEHLLQYSEADAVSCLKITQKILPLELELAKVTGFTLFEVSRATAGQMVESLLMRSAFQRGEVVPQKPGFSTVQSRLDDAIKGAFVKVPSPGLYENMVVFDFRSLYPSIITSHNIDPLSLNCECCATDGTAHKSPTGVHFCSKKKGVIAETLERVLKERFSIIDRMKKLDKKSDEYAALDARKFALKILANSVYGYLVYSRSRYYSRECGEATTAWARQYIQETIKKAEDNGFQVLYSDTDSCFMLLGDKSEKDALEFQKKINKDLPGTMEFELEDFYPRGIFVSKKQGEKGAKKKYALINRQGAIKIRGFELVRRDWSGVARKTQREVLEILLKEGNLDKAKKLVKQKMEDLKEGKIPKSELIITTQLRKSTKDYAVNSPELSAVKSAREKGVRIEEHSVVEYIITRQGKTTSDKAQIADLAKEGDYDVDYYTNNQLMPAVLKIMGALGVDEADLKQKGKQAGLGAWG